MSTADPAIVFLVCSERSGSNLIRVMAGAHSRITAPPPLHLARDIGAHLHAIVGAGRDAPAWQAMRDLIGERVAKYYGDEPARRALAAVDALPEPTFDGILKGVFRAVHTDPQKTILFIKENNLHEHLFFLLGIFPDAKFVFQVRDPRDYTASAKERKKGFLGNKFGSLRHCLELWRGDQLGGLKLLAHLGPQRVHVQRYEDLVGDPVGVLSGMCDFLGVPFEEGMLEFHEQQDVQDFSKKGGQWANLRKPVMSDNFGKYRKNLTRWQIRLVETAVGPIMERFGYARDLTDPERDSPLLSLWPGVTETLERWWNGERAPFYWDGRKEYDQRLQRLAAQCPVPLPTAGGQAPTPPRSSAPAPAARASGHVVGRVAAAAERHAGRDAITVRGETWTYDELLCAAAAVGRALDASAQPGESPVAAVVAERSFSAYAGVLGILLSGRTYVPLNPSHPADRLRSILERSGAPAIVCGPDGRAQLDAKLAELGETGARLRVVPCADRKGEGAGDGDWRAQVAAWARRREETGGNPHAYVLFTSGSTGVPKGVRISHANLEAYLDAVEELVPVTADDRFSQTFDLTFDLSVHDLFVAWSHGAHLFVATHDELRRADEYVTRNALTHWFSVPSLAFQMQAQGALRPGAFPALRWTLFCGEGLPQSLAARWAESAPQSVVENWYGPTEATISCTRHRIDDAAVAPENAPRGLVAIGRPFPRMDALVCTPELAPCPAEQPGELILTGPQVAEGYLDDAERTARAFVRLPDGTVGYRTGDRVVRDARGDLHYLDRLDNQVKIRGYRIDLGEVEAAVRTAVHGQNAIAVPWPVDEATPTSLVAAVEGAVGDADTVLAELRTRLPDYMVPNRVVALASFPKSAAGKADRKAVAQLVKEQAAAQPAHDPGFGPDTPERKLWDALAAVEPTAADVRMLAAGTLLDGGLDSLGFVALIARVESAFDVELSEQDVTNLSMMSFAEMAQALGERGELDHQKDRIQGRIVRAAQFLARFPEVLARRPAAPCLVVGSSGTFRGIAPAVLDAAAAEHGLTVRSFNIGLPGISCEGIAQLCEFLRDRCRVAGVTVPCAVIELDLMHVSVNPPRGDIDLQPSWLTNRNRLILEKDVGEFTWTEENAGDSASTRPPKRAENQARWERKRDQSVIETYAGMTEFDDTAIAQWLRGVAALGEVAEHVVAYVHPVGAADEVARLRAAESRDRYADVLARLREESGVRIVAAEEFVMDVADFLNLNHANPGEGRAKLTRQLAGHLAAMMAGRTSADAGRR